MYRLIAMTVMMVIVAAVAGCEAEKSAAHHNSAAPEFLSTAEMKKLDLPFSDAVRVGNLLFLSGKIGNTPGTMNLAPGGIHGETRQTLEHIRESLGRYGVSMDHVVKCTVFLADMAEWGAMNEVYKTFFPVNKPARSALGASGLALNARVEIECIAAIG